MSFARPSGLYVAFGVAWGPMAFGSFGSSGMALTVWVWVLSAAVQPEETPVRVVQPLVGRAGRH